AAARHGLAGLPDKVVALFDEAVAAHRLSRAGDYLATLRSLENGGARADALASKLADAWLDNAETSLDQGNRVAALKAIESARRLAPGSARLQALVGRLRSGGMSAGARCGAGDRAAGRVTGVVSPAEAVGLEPSSLVMPRPARIMSSSSRPGPSRSAGPAPEQGRARWLPPGSTGAAAGSRRRPGTRNSGARFPGRHRTGAATAPRRGTGAPRRRRRPRLRRPPARPRRR